MFPIIQWHTGFPLDVSANLSTRRSRPGPSGAGDSGLVFATLTGPITYQDPHSSADNTFFTANFTPPSDTVITGSYGSGRNILRGPDRANFDMAVAKATKITERVALQLRVEFFNVFNHTEFKEPQTNISVQSTLGKITTAYDPRIIQFGGRFTF